MLRNIKPYTKNKYHEMKDFEKIYQDSGAYHVSRKGFDKWWIEDNYKSIAKYIKDSDMVLDLACGEGKLSDYISNKMVGIDNSPTAIKLCKKYYSERYSKLYIEDMRSLKKLPIKKNSFDVVVCSISFMYLIPQDLEKCLIYLKILLKKNGKLVFTYPNVSSKRKANPTSAEITYVELKKIIKKAGYKNIKRINICPLVPSWVIKASKNLLFPIASLYYIIVKQLAKNNNEIAYHYLVVANV